MKKSLVAFFLGLSEVKLIPASAATVPESGQGGINKSTTVRAKNKNKLLFPAPSNSYNSYLYAITLRNLLFL